MEALEDRRLLATFTVANTDDSGPGSLRGAIEQANSAPGQDTIVFSPAVTGTITLRSALPDLSTDIVLEGPGASVLTVARSSAAETPAFRIFTVAAGAEVVLSGLTLTGGRAQEDGGFVNSSGGGISNAGTLTVTASTLSANAASRAGGGISNAGMLTVIASTLSGNAVSGAGGSGSGGGIFNEGTLTVTASTLSGNSASGFITGRIGGPGDGGGIANTGTLTVIASTLSGNAARGGPGIFSSGRGGGISNAGTLTVITSTLSLNVASGGGFGLTSGSGGGISNAGTLTVIASTLSGNAATGGNSGSGGGISNEGTLTVTASTLSNNIASGSAFVGLGSGFGNGGGIVNSGTLTVTASTLSGNAARGVRASGGGISTFSFTPSARLTVHTSIFANGLGGNLVGSAVNSLGHNLFTDRPDVTLGPTDITDTQPLLGPLANNGGTTFTHALLPGSPAIDAGATVPNLTTDQRGIPRPQGSAPDIGAFESRGFTLAVVGGDGQRTFALSPFSAPLVVAVTSPFGEPVEGGRVTFTAPETGASATFTDNPATVGASGQASVTATANSIVGTYTVAAEAAGAPRTGLTLTNERRPTTVLDVQRRGFHARPSRIVLTFSTPLDPAPAGRLSNYQLLTPGPDQIFGTGDERTVRLLSAAVGPDALTVTLTPQPQLPLRGRRFQLIVNGTPPGGLSGQDGLALDGEGDGQPGGDFVTTFGAEEFVPPRPLRIPRTDPFNRPVLRDRVPTQFQAILQRLGLAAVR